LSNNQWHIQGVVLGVNPPFLRKNLQFQGGFQEKNTTPPKFSCPHKNISNPLPRKISGYATKFNPFSSKNAPKLAF